MTASHFHSHVDDPAAVGRRLKEARLAAGLSQRQLSFPGCSAAYVSRLEAGDRVPSLQLLRKLAQKLNADEQYLATGVERVEQVRPRMSTRRSSSGLRGSRASSGTAGPPAGSTTPPNGPASSGSTRGGSCARATGAAPLTSRATRSPCSTTRTTARSTRRVADMEQRVLGRSGVEVSRLILGCGNFGGIGSAPAFFGQGENESEAHALMDAAWEAGITAFDTADAYGGGRSETFVGSWLRSARRAARHRRRPSTR